jgi:hypothetical protein
MQQGYYDFHRADNSYAQPRRLLLKHRPDASTANITAAESVAMFNVTKVDVFELNQPYFIVLSTLL